MKFPWQKRADQMHEETLKAKEDLKEIKDRWPQVENVTRAVKKHRQTNHWANEIQVIFTGRGH